MINRNNYIVELFEDVSRVAALTRDADLAEKEEAVPQDKTEDINSLDEQKETKEIFPGELKVTKTEPEDANVETVEPDIPKAEEPKEKQKRWFRKNKKEIQEPEIEDTVIDTAEPEPLEEEVPKEKSRRWFGKKKQEILEEEPETINTDQIESDESILEEPNATTEEPVIIKEEPEAIKEEPESVPDEPKATSEYWFLEKEQKLEELIKAAEKLKQEVMAKRSESLESLETPERSEESSDDYDEEERAPRKGILTSASFYVILLMAMIAVVLFAGSHPRNLFKYSYHPLLSSSMQSEIPRGSLVITKKVDPNTIKVGDNITYLQINDTTITHMVIDVYDNYADTGSLGFKTKGVNNPEPDEDIVYAENVVGVVKFHIAAIGDFIVFIRNMWFAFAALGIVLFVSSRIRMFLKARKEEELESEQEDISE